ncbi:MAG: FISUMP domain-containing protein [Saprospiraceae bacterium]
MRNSSSFITCLIIFTVAAIAGCREDKTTELKELKIGGQVWSAKNLSLPSEGSWCVNDCSESGRFYTWEAAMQLADSLDGWELPSDEDWRALENFLGGDSLEDKLPNRTGGKELKNYPGFQNFPGCVWMGEHRWEGERIVYWSSDTINYKGKRLALCRSLFNGGMKTDQICNIYNLANDSVGLSLRLIKSID